MTPEQRAKAQEAAEQDCEDLVHKLKRGEHQPRKDGFVTGAQWGHAQGFEDGVKACLEKLGCDYLGVYPGAADWLEAEMKKEISK